MQVVLAEGSWSCSVSSKYILSLSILSQGMPSLIVGDRVRGIQRGSMSKCGSWVGALWAGRVSSKGAFSEATRLSNACDAGAWTGGAWNANGCYRNRRGGALSEVVRSKTERTKGVRR
jgi:hypothetical protein